MDIAWPCQVNSCPGHKATETEAENWIVATTALLGGLSGRGGTSRKDSSTQDVQRHREAVLTAGN